MTDGPVRLCIFLEAGLTECPSCHHRSFDPICGACERRRCGYQAPR